MSYLKSNFNLCVFEVPQNSLNASEIHDLLTQKAFVELLASEEFGDGWCSMEDMFNSNFGLAEVNFSEYIAAGYRYDQKLIPKALIRKLYKGKLKARSKEEKLSKVDRQILKEECKAELVIKTLAKPNSVHWIWDIKSNLIYLDTKSSKTVDNFIMLFTKTFGLNLTSKNYGLVEDQLSRFLDNIWTNIETMDGVWIDTNVVFDANKTKFNFSGSDLESYLKEIESIKKDKPVEKLGICIAIKDADYSIGFTNKNFIVTVKDSAKMKFESVDAAVIINSDRMKLITNKILNLVKNYYKGGI